jgi:hypothetical protein
MMYMYHQKVINKKTKFIFYFLLESLRSLTERAESGASSGSVSPWYGSADPDPYRNVRNPEHWVAVKY